ncbi:hypothetical protein O4J56_02355 [Nocardiopsis sp. RSe5-2]|uniref:Lipoprotein n=1 Tax=Nocardiopsis endophytica TaxID=3018445 RepID=A0ABT4TXR5_9ACTN|nr:hypothetical protein [Nocardiopsis endophytica]MDA2809469.1 hypothetical protein [Nocardiopsis endophytica]
MVVVIRSLKVLAPVLSTMLVFGCSGGPMGNEDPPDRTGENRGDSIQQGDVYTQLQLTSLKIQSEQRKEDASEEFLKSLGERNFDILSSRGIIQKEKGELTVNDTLNPQDPDSWVNDAPKYDETKSALSDFEYAYTMNHCGTEISPHEIMESYLDESFGKYNTLEEYRDDYYQFINDC